MTRPARLTPAACLARLPEPVLEIDEDDNPLDDLRAVELRRSVLAIAGLDHVSEMRLVDEFAARERAT
ncbi:hypothetical protein Dvina_03275 [Dactylosporangium vinaceum]|uniref:Uncharacterized protein n=1 Tax=Dactylosporangium vinaceum TaxID=53362 RepID=A0ABV5M0Y2_9ACTN|nr:hypothetical protein [Dactylosporangium vinaceum]UAB97229.1 hypothetical protein Dvina_03275 [Dactylosporangium vinaceum]